MKRKFLALFLLAFLGLLGVFLGAQTNSQNYEGSRASRGNLFSERLIYAQGGGAGVEVPIPVGGVINGTTVVLRADIYDSGASVLTPKTLKMEVEIKKVAIPFDSVTNLYSSGSQSFLGGDPITMSVQIDNLELGESYKWRVRAVNVANGLASDWRDFGNNGDNPDFTITRVNRLDLVSNKAEVEWGEKLDLTITAYDMSGVVADTYRGDVRIRSVSPNVTFTPDGVTFTSQDAGIVSLPQSVSFLASGTYTIEIYDLANSMLTDTVDVTVLPPKIPILQLSSDKATIEAGDNVTLSWSSAFVSDIHLQYDTSDVQLNDPSGNILISPIVTTTYTLVGTGIYGENMSSTVTVTVTPYRVPSLQLSSDVNEIFDGGSVTLSWTSAYVDGLTLTIGSQTIDLTDLTELIVAPAVTTEYILSGTGVHGEAMESKLTVTVNYRNPVLELHSNASTITEGDSVTLTWDAVYVSGLTLTIGEQVIDLSTITELVVAPVATTEYILKGTDVRDQAMESRLTVTVITNPNKPEETDEIILSLKTDKTKIDLGESVNLSWTVQNVNDVVLYGNGKKVIDIFVGGARGMAVKPVDDMEYVLVGYDKDGNKLQSKVNIDVNTVVLELKTNKDNITAGDKVELSWTISNVTDVVLYKGDTKILDIFPGGVQSVVVSPTETTEYTLAGYDPDGNRIERKLTIVVTPVETPEEEMIIKEFRVSDNEVKPGDIVIVTWDVINADTVLLNVANGEVGANGSLSVRVDDDMIVELKAIKNGKEITRELKITVQRLYTWEMGGVGLGGLVLVEVLGFTFLPLQGSVPALGNLWYAILGLFESNRRKKPWGIVYDSVSKDVLGRSIVRVFDVTTGKLLQTVVSQVNGMFNISLGKGKYRLEVSRGGYIYPSIIVVGKDDGGYPNVYKGETLEVKSDKELVMISVPMDPENANGVKKFGRSLGLRFYLLLSLLINAGFFFGFIYTVYVTYQNSVLYNWIVCALYGVIILGKLLVLVFKPRSYGILRIDGRIQSDVEIMLYETEFNTLSSKVKTDMRGRYNFLVENKDYNIKVINNGHEYQVYEAKDKNAKHLLKLITRNLSFQSTK